MSFCIWPAGKFFALPVCPAILRWSFTHIFLLLHYFPYLFCLWVNFIDPACFLFSIKRYFSSEFLFLLLVVPYFIYQLTLFWALRLFPISVIVPYTLSLPAYPCPAKIFVSPHNLLSKNVPNSPFLAHFLTDNLYFVTPWVVLVALLLAVTVVRV